MCKYQQHVKVAKDAGVSLGRDAALKPRDCGHTLAEAIWKLHEDEATSTHLFQQRHHKDIFTHKEQLQPAQPQNSGQKLCWAFRQTPCRPMPLSVAMPVWW